MKRHTGVLFEALQHKLDLVIKGQQFLREQIADFHSELVSQFRETRALIQLSYQQLDQRVENLERRL